MNDPVAFGARTVTALSVLLAAGCVEPNAPASSGRDGDLAGFAIAPDAREPAYMPSAQWDPLHGRLGAYLRQRHIAPGGAAQDADDLRLFAERFESLSPSNPAPWVVIGHPTLRIATEGGSGRYLMLSAEPVEGVHGIERELHPDNVRGRLIRVRLRTLLTSAARVRHFGAPQLRWAVLTTSGQMQIVRLPLRSRASPDWETQEFLTWFNRDVAQVWLQIVHVNSSTPCGFDDVLVEQAAPAQFEWLARPAPEPAIATSPPPPVTTAANLLRNGGFEAGPSGVLVWAEADWPGRGHYATACPWTIVDGGATGRRALAVVAEGAPAHVVLGPFDLAPRAPAARPSDRYYLRFFAKASRPVEVEAIWRIAGMEPRSQTMRIGADWQPYRGLFLTPIELLHSAAPATAELEFRVSPDGGADPYTFWLDGVSFGATEPGEKFDPPSSVEVGVIGASNPTDLGDLFDLGEPANLTVRVVNYADASYTGTIAADLVDAFDRPVWSRSMRPLVGPAAIWEERWTRTLPRGHYRLKVTAWSATAGSSSIVAQDERAFAVVNLTDGVPRRAYFGLSADAGRLSARTTQLGTGWVSMPFDVRWSFAAGGDEFAGWKRATQAATPQEVDVVACLEGLLADGQLRNELVRRWLAVGGDRVMAMRVDAKAAGGGADVAATPDAVRRRLGLAGRESPAVVVEASPRTLRDVTTTAPTSLPAPAATQPVLRDGYSFHCVATDVPESAEEQFDRWRRVRIESTGQSAWDLFVPGDTGSAYAHRPSTAPATEPLIVVQAEPVDPVVSASRLVRSMVLSYFSGADFACSTVCAFRPYTSFLESASDCLNEYDHAPRPALVAWDWMAELLNTATPRRWYDMPFDVRALAFDRADGGVVIAIWRPYGHAQQVVTLAGRAAKAQVYDVFGRPEPGVVRGADLVVPVDEVLRYIVVSGAERDGVLSALETAVPAAKE